MEPSSQHVFVRGLLASLVVGLFMFPIFWWGLTSIKPVSAIFDKDRIVWFDFSPTMTNYEVTLFGKSRSEIAIDQGIGQGTGGSSAYDSRETILDSVIVSLGSTIVAVAVALFASYALSRMAFRFRNGFMNWVLGQRFLPPIAIIVPLVSIYKIAGLRDTDSVFAGYLGLILIYAVMNLPIAILLLKSFLDDLPKELDEASMIDGCSRFQTFVKIILPLLRGGVSATAVLCFVFAWTEFLLSLFLTSDIRTVPVKIQTFVTSTSTEWGFIAALGTAAMIPGFIFISLVQRHLVRGLTLGSLKE